MYSYAKIFENSFTGVLEKTAKISQFFLTKVCVANFFI